jgi:DNA-binding response OmpR family regulator
MSDNKIKILIVDDEEDFSFFLARNLERLNIYEIISAREGQTGLEKAKQHKPDLIFLDIMMPGIDGLEVLKRLKDDDETASIPVVMLTGRAEEECKVKAEGLGDDDYIEKPVEIEKLRSRIEKILAKNKSRET